MAKQRARPKRKAASPAAPKRSGARGHPDRGPRPASPATRHGVGGAEPEAALEGRPVAVWCAAGILGAYGLLLLISAWLPSAHAALMVGPTLATRGGFATALVGAAALAAAAGMGRRMPQAWWLGAVLAQFLLWCAGWEAIASDVATQPGAASGDLPLLSALARLALFVTAAWLLHSYTAARVFRLSWSREAERQRTHRVIFYGAGLAVALHLSAQWLGRAAPPRHTP